MLFAHNSYNSLEPFRFRYFYIFFTPETRNIFTEAIYVQSDSLKIFFGFVFKKLSSMLFTHNFSNSLHPR